MNRKRFSIGLLITLLLAGLVFSGTALAQGPAGVDVDDRPFWGRALDNVGRFFGRSAGANDNDVRPCSEFVDEDGYGICDLCGEYGYGYGYGKCDGACDEPIQQRLADGTGDGHAYGRPEGARGPLGECDGTCDEPIQQRLQDGSGMGSVRGGRWTR